MRISSGKDDVAWFRIRELPPIQRAGYAQSVGRRWRLPGIDEWNRTIFVAVWLLLLKWPFLASDGGKWTCSESNRGLRCSLKGFSPNRLPFQARKLKIGNIPYLCRPIAAAVV